MEWLLKLLFGCRHRGKMSWPFTSEGRTLRTCLDCGKDLPFDAETWQFITPKQFRRFRKENANYDGSPVSRVRRTQNGLGVCFVPGTRNLDRLALSPSGQPLPDPASLGDGNECSTLVSHCRSAVGEGDPLCELNAA